MTREEAIEVYNGLINEKIKAAFEFFVPELRKSEDERIRHALIEFLREAYSRGNAPEECAKWIVWLDQPKEQKPAEWSEEDSIMLDSILCVIEEWESNQSEKEKEYYGATPKADWLKSLCPSLKPNDEQAVEGKIVFLLNGDVAINIGDTDKYKLGDKVRLIILPKED